MAITSLFRQKLILVDLFLQEYLLKFNAIPRKTPGNFWDQDLGFLEPLSVKNVVELGANDGSDTARLLEVFPNAHVYAFEPEPRALDLFSSKKFGSRVTLIPAAVASYTGEAQFHQSSGSPPGASHHFPSGYHLSGSIREPTRHEDLVAWCSFESVIQVPCVSLDSWWRDQALGHIDLVWADVQGAEGDVIDGGRHALTHTRYLYTEYTLTPLYSGQPRFRALLKMLPDWEVVRRFPNDVLLRNTRFRHHR